MIFLLLVLCFTTVVISRINSFLTDAAVVRYRDDIDLQNIMDYIQVSV